MQKKEYFSTKEAAKIVGCASTTILNRLNRIVEKNVKTGQSRAMFHKTDVYALRKEFRENHRNRNKTVNTCNMKRVGEDPYNTWQGNQHRGRKCPVCGIPVPTGIYRCSKCSIQYPGNSRIDGDWIFSY